MPLSEEEKRERNKARGAAWRQKIKNDPERLERVKANKRAWQEANREKHMESVKKWAQANKEKVRETHRNWIERNREKATKRSRIDNWKKSGIICDDWDELYISYMAHERCMDCGCEFGDYGDGTGTFKCLDHNHLTGEIRGILCSLCNIRRGP